jgi:hypothetical protein
MSLACVTMKDISRTLLVSWGGHVEASSKQCTESCSLKTSLDEVPERMWTNDKREEKWLKVGP